MGAAARKIDTQPDRGSHLRVARPARKRATSRTSSSAASGAARTQTSRANKRAGSGTSTHTKAKRAPARTVARTSARPGSRSEAGYRTVFSSFMVVCIAVTVLGVARVAVIARATEMTLSANELLGAIQEQRIEAGQLEVDKSSLSTPSRLESIAGATMGMTRPRSVRYIKMPAETPSEVASDDQVAADAAEVAVTPPTGSSADTTPEEPGGFLGALIDISAGEAQSLLLGDVGLAGAR